MRVRVLLVCEGNKTEPHYLEQLKKHPDVSGRFAVTIKRGAGGDRRKIAKNAISRKREYEDEFDKFCCIMDVEGPAHRASLEEALKSLHANGVEVYLSNPSFEVWLLAHFEMTAKWFGDASQAFEALNLKWKKEFSQPYEKGCRDAFDRLHAQLGEAIKNARQARSHHGQSTKMMDANSASEVFILVENFDVLGCFIGEGRKKAISRWVSPSVE